MMLIWINLSARSGAKAEIECPGVELALAALLLRCTSYCSFPFFLVFIQFSFLFFVYHPSFPIILALDIVAHSPVPSRPVIRIVSHSFLSRQIHRYMHHLLTHLVI